ncbi:hypothetical protein B0H10DRAFT_1770793 [Mycena sp. CBHHK59/15]|nr:hypothetical protein B0H10DRAFT_1770793 [Mycena sp. CBHHK59/15]
MKKLAACNFEDLLQCALPVFKELLDDEHNKAVLDLLFALAYWHPLAKLCLLTDSTVDRLKEVTAHLSRQLRHCNSCAPKLAPLPTGPKGHYDRKAAAAAAAGTAPLEPTATGSKTKFFNMFTYKGHSLGDYVRTILFFGIIDSYSMQPIHNILKPPPSI